MFKKLQPKQAPYKISQYPHCDQRVLHAPGDCEYCDKHPMWQALRKGWGISFTGYIPEGTEVGCPSEAARPLEKIEAWPGNQPCLPSAAVSAGEPAPGSVPWAGDRND